MNMPKRKRNHNKEVTPKLSLFIIHWNYITLGSYIVYVIFFVKGNLTVVLSHQNYTAVLISKVRDSTHALHTSHRTVFNNKPITNSR